jgi:hypothetical protein
LSSEGSFCLSIIPLKIIILPEFNRGREKQNGADKFRYFDCICVSNFTPENRRLPALIKKGAYPQYAPFSVITEEIF